MGTGKALVHPMVWVRLVACVPAESHWVEGNPVGMIPTSAQAYRLRKSLSTWSVM